MFWYTFKTELSQKASLACSSLFKSPTTYAVGQHKCLHRLGKPCWETDECVKQPFQSDICAFQSHTLFSSFFFFFRSKWWIYRLGFSHRVIAYCEIILAFFGVFSRFSTAGDSCQTEHQEKLVCKLRWGRKNNMDNFVTRCTRIYFALLMAILD